MSKTNKSFLQRASELLASVTGRSVSFQQREGELTEQLAKLSAQKAEVMAAYDPDKGIDSSALQRINAEVSETETELTALTHARKVKPDKDAHEAVSMITDVRSEAASVLALKAAEQEAVRADITASKAAYLAALRKHDAIQREADFVALDYNDTVRQLSTSVKAEVARLRIAYQALDNRIAQEAGSLVGTRHNQAAIDEMYEERNAIMRNIQSHETQLSAIPNPARAIGSFALSGAGNPLLISDLEAKRAARGEGAV